MENKADNKKLGVLDTEIMDKVIKTKLILENIG